MPKAPAFIGNLAESAIGRRARVLAVTDVAPGFIEVVLRADQPSGGWRPGHEVQVRPTAVHGRRYSVRHVDRSDPERIRILAALDAGGPGTTWLRGLRAGAETTLLAGRHVPLRQHGSRRLYLGDGSALGTFDACSAETTDPIIVVEVPPASVERLGDRYPGYRFLAAGDAPGDAAQAWLERMLGAGAPPALDAAVLLGHAQSIQRQRNALLRSGVLDRRAITTKPYWATGRAGL